MCAKLTRTLNGTYINEAGENQGNLDLAASNPREGSKDADNVKYARERYGFTPAGEKTGISNTNPALPNTGSLTPPEVPEPENEADIFNLMTRDALMKFQGVNTADLEKKKRALQFAALDKSSELTPVDLRSFSPAQQKAIRDGDIAALQPEFDDVSYQLNKAKQATTNFENTFDKVMQINAEYAEKMSAPEGVIDGYKQIIENDPSQLDKILSKSNDKTKDALMSVLDFSKLQPKEEDKILSVSEAKSLGVPYGTTQAAATKLNITPSSKTGNGTPKEDPIFKFSSDDRGRLIAANFNSNEITQIQSDINEFGVEQVVEGMDEKQANAIRNIAKGVTPTQENKVIEEEKSFLTDEFIKEDFADALISEAEELFPAEDYKDFWLGKKKELANQKADIDKYIKAEEDKIIAKVKRLREAGFTDEEINKQL